MTPVNRCRFADCKMQNAKCKLQIVEPPASSPQPPAPILAPRLAFTLFELILAIALSAALLILIGSAINLYLLQVDASRTRVEEAQLARSVLSMIAADVRATTVYQTQDISAIEQLAASAASFDVDEIDQAGTFTSGATTASGATSGTVPAGAAATSSSTTLGVNESSTTLAPGLNGTLRELILDVMRLPRLDELYPAAAVQPGATSLTAANVPRPSDIKTVRYLVRQGNPVEASDAATTSLAAEAQLQVGGLVRQTLDSAVRDTAERSGNTALLEGGQVLVAPEVVHAEFRYFDGVTAFDQWNMENERALPLAVEVRIWIADSSTADYSQATSGAVTGALEGARMYSQTVYLPLSQATPASSANASSDATADTGTSDSSTAPGSGGNFGSQAP